jgi:hypothetical protein
MSTYCGRRVRLVKLAASLMSVLEILPEETRAEERVVWRVGLFGDSDVWIRLFA